MCSVAGRQHGTPTTKPARDRPRFAHTHRTPRCTRYAVCPPGAALLLSGAADGDLRLWAWHGGAETNSLPPWSAVAVLHGHESAVTSLALLQSSPGTLLLASTSADVQIRIWECMYGRAAAPPDEPELQQAETDNNAATRHALALDLATRFGTQAWIQQPPVPVGTRVQHCVALASLPQAGPGWTVMATGGTDSIVRLYVLGPTGDCTAPAAAAAAAAPPTAAAYALNAKQLYSAVFQLQCELKGHENWVRSLALTTVQEEGNGGTSLLLASAAQDRCAASRSRSRTGVRARGILVHWYNARDVQHQHTYCPSHTPSLSHLPKQVCATLAHLRCCTRRDSWQSRYTAQ